VDLSGVDAGRGGKLENANDCGRVDGMGEANAEEVDENGWKPDETLGFVLVCEANSWWPVVPAWGTPLGIPGKAPIPVDMGSIMLCLNGLLPVA
jgi:hypothetical protein